MLKKEFKRKDVNRMRNLITGNANASSETQIGYKKKTIEHKEGDIWVENKKTWTIKNGVKQTISKLDKIKQEIHMPLCCPECNKVMKKRLDKPNYRVHKKCLDCVILTEHKMQIDGTYKQYKKDLRKKNDLEYLNKLESYLLDAVNESNNNFISENGEIERWVGGINQKKIIKDIVSNSSIIRKNIKDR